MTVRRGVERAIVKQYAREACIVDRSVDWRILKCNERGELYWVLEQDLRIEGAELAFVGGSVGCREPEDSLEFVEPDPVVVESMVDAMCGALERIPEGYFEDEGPAVGLVGIERPVLFVAGLVVFVVSVVLGWAIWDILARGGGL